MKKRIEELAVQAGMQYRLGSAINIAEDGNHIIEEFNVYDTFDSNKFAELLLEEFRSILADASRECPLECAGHFFYADEKIAAHFYGVNG